MKTRDELKRELESDAEILRKYFMDVSIVDDGRKTINISLMDHYGKVQNFFREYKTYPPRGEICLYSVTTGYGIPVSEHLCISLGNGEFADDIDDLKTNNGVRWNEYRSLGVNILDKLSD